MTRGVLEVPPRMIRRVGGFADACNALSDSQFFAATVGRAAPLADDTWTSVGLNHRRHLVSESRAWIPTGTAATPKEEVAVATTVGDAAVRVDLARDVDHADVSLFAPSETLVPVAFPDKVTDWN